MTVIGHSDVKTDEKNVSSDGKKSSSIPENASEWGYDLYPGRKSQAKAGGKAVIDNIHCERNVYRCIKESPLVKLMMGALKASGCAIDIRRHISCEDCDPTVSGGFDPILNQVIVCQNTTRKIGLVQSVLTHEMIHMFDYCRNDLDFKNIDHLACTEVRAANLAHCSFMSAFFSGDATIFYFKKMHQNCVKNKAASSVMAARNISKEEALAAVERVFDRCYADLEPIGRRIRRNSEDMYKAYDEGGYYGYLR